MRISAALLWACGLAILAGVALSGSRVRSLEAAEMSFESEPRSLASLAKAPGSSPISARLAKLELRAGDDTVFELCAADPMRAPRWRHAFVIGVFRLLPPATEGAEPGLEKMLTVPLDDAHLELVQRNGAGACLKLGGGVVEQGGDYSIDAVWPDTPPDASLRTVPLRVRVMARDRLAPTDRYYVMLIAGGIMLVLAIFFFGPVVGESRPVQTTAAFLAPGLLLVALVAASQLPLYGSTLALVKGVGMFALQVGGALWLARRFEGGATAGLALGAPRQRMLFIAVGLASGIALVFAARLSLRLIPSTSEAPIQTFVSWPSGMLSFAALGVLLPFAEELFFRGYLYGAALRRGPTFAFVITLVLFVALHAQQSWGNWGGLTAILLTGTILTALRAASGTVVVPAIAHLIYNCTLSLGSL